MIDTPEPLTMTRRSASPKQTQPVKETAKALAAFNAYCELGVGRSLAKLAKAPETFGRESVSLRQLEYWSSMHNWVERAAAYDRHQAELRRRQQEQALEAMNERHALIGVNLQRQMLERIKVLLEQDNFGASSAVQLLKLAIDIERLARGAATELSKVEVTGDPERPLIIKTVWDRALLTIPQESTTQEPLADQGEERE